MNSSQVRQPETELEQRLVSTDAILSGETIELSEEEKGTLSCYYVIEFNYIVTRPLVAKSRKPSDVFLIIGNDGDRSRIPINLKVKNERYFSRATQSNVTDRIIAAYGDGLKAIVFKEIKPEINQFDVPIRLANKRSYDTKGEPRTISGVLRSFSPSWTRLNICTGTATANVSGHAFYRK